MWAQWVHRMLLPAGPNEALWCATPLYWANQALGVTTAADNILTADKPLSTSPLVVSAQDRDVPPQWQACFKSYGQVFVSQDTSEAPATALEVLAQPLFHNIRLAGPHGEPLATWTDCVSHPTRTTTRVAWDQKWSGLQRRTPHKVVGHEAADGGATSDGWLHQEEQRTCRRNSIA